MPVSETSTFGIGYDISLTDFTTTIGSPIIVTHHIADHGNTAFGIKLKGNYITDTRNRTVFAETGVLTQVKCEIFF